MGFWRQARAIALLPGNVAVAAVLAGEAMLLGSAGILVLAVAFPLLNTAHFLLAGEPGLEGRFGEEYRAYRRDVPRWIPRLRPWRPT